MAGKTDNYLYHLVALVTVVIWGSTRDVASVGSPAHGKTKD